MFTKARSTFIKLLPWWPAPPGIGHIARMGAQYGGLPGWVEVPVPPPPPSGGRGILPAATQHRVDPEGRPLAIELAGSLWVLIY